MKKIGRSTFKPAKDTRFMPTDRATDAPESPTTDTPGHTPTAIDEPAHVDTPATDDRHNVEAGDGQPSATEASAHEAPAHEAPVDDAPESAVHLPALEALLFSTHHPLTPGRLAELLDVPGTKPVRHGIKELNAQYESTGRSFRIEQVAGGFQLCTLPEFGPLLHKFHQKEADSKLTNAAKETLAIIAYKQPILRADIEAIRGVACGETIRSLMEKHLVKIAGRAELPGRPILYGTTKRFLEWQGLNTLKDLPPIDGAPR